MIVVTIFQSFNLETHLIAFIMNVKLKAIFHSQNLHKESCKASYIIRSVFCWTFCTFIFFLFFCWKKKEKSWTVQKTKIIIARSSAKLNKYMSFAIWKLIIITKTRTIFSRPISGITRDYAVTVTSIVPWRIRNECLLLCLFMRLDLVISPMVYIFLMGCTRIYTSPPEGRNFYGIQLLWNI